MIHSYMDGILVKDILNIKEVKVILAVMNILII